MNLIVNRIFRGHDINHPENKHRLDRFLDYPETAIETGEQYLTLAHTHRYIEQVKAASSRSQNLDPDTMTCRDSYTVACHAVGASILAAETNGFALVRPPGHHACRNRAMGFCLFNNMAIAAQYMVNKGQRVFILDFDIHHGNGIEDILGNEPDIFYFSSHQFPLFPGTGLHNRKNAVNIPLEFGTEDDVYIETVIPQLRDALNRFEPDTVGVCAGFDSYYKDFTYMNFMAGFRLTEKSYHALRKTIEPYSKFFTLEGGYNPDSIKEGVELFTG